MPSKNVIIDRPQVTQEYPVLLKVLHAELLSIYRPATALVNVTVRVQRADAELLFRQGVHQASVTHPTDAHMCGLTHEAYYPVYARLPILGGRRGAPVMTSTYPRDMFEGFMGDFLKVDPEATCPFTAIGAVVWVRYTVWTQFDADGFPLGSPKQIDMELTYFKEPVIGWFNLYCGADPLSNVTLRGESLLGSALGVCTQDMWHMAVNDRLNRLTMRFMRDVWLDGLSDHVRLASSVIPQGRTMSVATLVRSTAVGGERLLLSDGLNTITLHMWGKGRFRTIVESGTMSGIERLFGNIDDAWRQSANAFVPYGVPNIVVDVP